MPDRLSILGSSEWDVPLTEHFVDRVRVGVRRRSRRRWAARGVVVAAAAAVVAIVAASGVLRSTATPQPVVPATAAPTPVPLDHYAFEVIPPGLTLAGTDGYDKSVLSPDGLDPDRRQPGQDEPGVSIIQRRYTYPNGGSALFLTVLRPTAPTAGPSTPILQGWLVDWFSAGAERSAPFAVPAGTAYLVTHHGSEGDTFGLIVVTRDAVVTVEGPGDDTAQTLRAIAAGIRAAS